MWSRIDRYLIKEVLLTFSATILVLLAMVLINRLAGYMNQAAAGRIARDVIFLLLGLQAIRFLMVLVPGAFLLGSMIALGRLYRDNEMTALAACGVGPGAIYRPLLLLAVPMALLLAGLTLYVLPLAMDLQFELQARARQSAEVSIFRPGTFREVAGGQHVIYVGGLANGGQELRKVFIHSREQDSIAITTSERGHQEIDLTSGVRYLILSDGYRYEGNPGQGDYQNVQFARLAVKVDTTPPEQHWLHRETISTAELWASTNPSYSAELHHRLSGPVSLLLVTFLAPLLARAHPREGRYSRVVAAILIYIIYINLLGVGQSWIERGVIWTSLGLWWVHGLLALLGLAMWHYYYGGGALMLRRFVRGRYR